MKQFHSESSFYSTYSLPCKERISENNPSLNPFTMKSFIVVLVVIASANAISPGYGQSDFSGHRPVRQGYGSAPVAVNTQPMGAGGGWSGGSLGGGGGGGGPFNQQTRPHGQGHGHGHRQGQQFGNGQIGFNNGRPKAPGHGGGGGGGGYGGSPSFNSAPIQSGGGDGYGSPSFGGAPIGGGQLNGPKPGVFVGEQFNGPQPGGFGGGGLGSPSAPIKQVHGGGFDSAPIIGGPGQGYGGSPSAPIKGGGYDSAPIIGGPGQGYGGSNQVPLISKPSGGSIGGGFIGSGAEDDYSVAPAGAGLGSNGGGGYGIPEKAPTGGAGGYGR